jgi:competence protein ComEA
LSERWLPERTADPPRWRLVFLAGGAVVVGVAVAIGFTLSGAPDQLEVPPALPAASVSEVEHPVSATPSAEDPIVISVVGRVVTPGLVTVPAGSRVADALAAAGGPEPGARLDSLNLARRLSDGEQLYVGVPTPVGAEGPAEAPADGGSGTTSVDLNSASLAELDTLPGVGPVTAQRILDWRTQHGRFTSVEQLREIEGIGTTRFSKLKDLVVAG